MDEGLTVLVERCERLLHPQLGIKRGIIDRTEPGKGSPDNDDDLIPVAIGEIREVHNVLAALKARVRSL